MRIFAVIGVLLVIGCDSPEVVDTEAPDIIPPHDIMISAFLDTTNNEHIRRMANEGIQFEWHHVGIADSDTAVYDMFEVGHLTDGDYAMDLMVYVNMKKKVVYQYDMAQGYLLVNGGTSTRPEDLPTEISPEVADSRQAVTDSLVDAGSLRMVKLEKESRNGGIVHAYYQGEDLILITSEFAGAESLNFTDIYYHNGWPYKIAYSRRELFSRDDVKRLVEQTDYYLTGYVVTDAKVIVEAEWGATYREPDDFIRTIRSIESEFRSSMEP